jgi:hypothetical protein
VNNETKILVMVDLPDRFAVFLLAGHFAGNEFNIISVKYGEMQKNQRARGGWLCIPLNYYKMNR